MIKVNVGEWKSAWHEPPTEDGLYLVVSFRRYSGKLSHGRVIEYTVEYGWNTTSYNHEFGISFENRDDVWTTLNRTDMEDEENEEAQT